jgi:hypothetical protein
LATSDALPHEFDTVAITLTRSYSTTMAPIDDAIAAARSQESLNLAEISRIHRVARSTLLQRLRGVQHSKSEQYENQRLLTDIEERVLFDQINHLTETGPTSNFSNGSQYGRRDQ